MKNIQKYLKYKHFFVNINYFSSGLEIQPKAVVSIKIYFFEL